MEEEFGDVEIEFNDNLNPMWFFKIYEDAATQEGVQSLYNFLVKEKEIRFSKLPSVIYNNAEHLPEYHELPSVKTIKKHVSDMLLRQYELARLVCSNNSFTISLKKRLIILKRMYYALFMEYHDKPIPEIFRIEKDEKLQVDNVANNSKQVTIQNISSNKALLEVGVKTGVNLVFTLLKQNLLTSKSLGIPSMCDSVLQTASDLIYDLPPLALSNEEQITKLGLGCLDQVISFLKDSILENTVTEKETQTLALEIMLGLALKRGDLVYMLEWIEFALNIACKNAEIMITKDTLEKVLTEMNCVFQFHDIEFCSEFNLCEVSCILLQSFVLLCYRSICKVRVDGTIKYYGDCLTYAWGSNEFHQIHEREGARVLLPTVSEVFNNALQIEAGLCCTFIVGFDGSVKVIGQGHGRMGRSNARDQKKLIEIKFNKPIKLLSSSKGSDGHTLALTYDGSVFSWGDGDDGKLGHGNVICQGVPKLIETELTGRIIKWISAGFRHSAAATVEGELYTWGDGSCGRLGHGSQISFNVPVRVKSISNVGIVSCGNSHTLAVSKDGRTVWSFGSGSDGKLGHGDTCTLFKPRVIEGLKGFCIVKICAGVTYSMALTSQGQIFTWGQGPCLGRGTLDFPCLVPVLINSIPSQVIDISAGEGNCLAVTENGEVFAWGKNTAGQCGVRDNAYPITTPYKIKELLDVNIKQVSAGSSHSIAWTTPPADKHLTNHKPYCLDLHPQTFQLIQSFLEKYANIPDDEILATPFIASASYHNFIFNCLKLLSFHINLCLINGLNVTTVLGNQSKQWRTVLFRVIDAPLSDKIKKEACKILKCGATLFFPTLIEQVQLLDEQVELGIDINLTDGQLLMFDIIWDNLRKPECISSILGYNKALGILQQHDTIIIKSLLKNLLKFYASDAEKHFIAIIDHLSSEKEETLEIIQCSKEYHLKQLLLCLQNNLIAHCTLFVDDTSIDILNDYLKCLLSTSIHLFSLLITLIKNQPTSLKLICARLLNSPAGAVLMRTITSLLLIPGKCIAINTEKITKTALLLNDVNKLILEIEDNDSQKSGTENSNSIQDSKKNWDWLIDLESTCYLLIGKLLNEKSLGGTPIEEEYLCNQWLKSPLFELGIENTTFNVDHIKRMANLLIFNMFEEILPIIKTLHPHTQSSIKMALDYVYKYEEYATENKGETCFFTALANGVDDYWKNPLLKMVLSCYLIMLLKYLGLLKIPCKDPCVIIVYEYVHELRRKLCDVQELNKFYHLRQSSGSINNENEDITNISYFNYKSFKFASQWILERCLFIIIYTGELNFDTSPIINQSDNTIDNYINPSTTKIADITKLANLLTDFVFNLPSEFIDTSNTKGWSTDLNTLWLSFNAQFERAKSRNDSLTDLLNLILHFKENSSIHSLNYPYSQLLAGYFSLNRPIDEIYIQFDHYLEGLEVAPHEITLKINVTAQSIITELLGLLKKTSLIKKTLDLQILTIFALSMNFKASDLHVIFKDDLIDVLVSQIQDWNLGATSITNQKQVLSIASIKLTNILAMTCRIYDEYVEVSIIERLVDNLFYLLQNIFKQYSKSTFSSTKSEYLLEFLLFLKIFSSSNKIQTFFVNTKWINTLFSISNNNNLKQKHNLRIRLLAFKLLEVILSSDYSKKLESSYKLGITNILFENLSKEMWKETATLNVSDKPTVANFLDISKDCLNGLNKEEEAEKLIIFDIGFNAKKCINCTVQEDLLLIHDQNGKGYGFGNHCIKRGCYQWKYLILKENKSNEGVCIGVSKYPIENANYNTSSDMWLYHSFDGCLYNKGEKLNRLEKFNQGDCITVLLNMETKTLSFGKNGEKLKIAFENIQANELYPCVVFYNNNSGEKIKIIDMQEVAMENELFPGEPYFAPSPMVLAESYVHLIRTLHSAYFWTNHVNDCIIKRLSTLQNYLSKIGNKNEGFNLVEHLDIGHLCHIVWPALAVIGGVDHGLKIGGLCKHKHEDKKGIILGVEKKGSKIAKVQWIPNGNISDTPFSLLENIETENFDLDKLTGITYQILLQIAQLSGITDDIKLPELHLTAEEEKLLLKEGTSSFPVNTNVKSIHNEPRMRTVESLTNALVSNIMNEVKKVSTEKILKNQYSSTVNNTDEMDKELAQKALVLKLKLLNIEKFWVYVLVLQFTALKTLKVLLSTRNNLTSFLTSDLVLSLLLKGTQKCKLKNIFDTKTFERAQNVLYYNYLQAKTKDRLNHERMRILEECDGKFVTNSTVKYDTFNSVLHQVSDGNASIETIASPNRDDVNRSSLEESNHSPIVNTLLDMGFRLDHILAAIEVTRSVGEITDDGINVLTTWMVENPIIEEQQEFQNLEDITRPTLTNSIPKQTYIQPNSLIFANKNGYYLIYDEQSTSHAKETSVEEDLVRDGKTVVLNEAIQKESSIDSTYNVLGAVFDINNSDEDSCICVLCLEEVPCIKAHMISFHPGCGTLCLKYSCGVVYESTYVLCNNCKNVFSVSEATDTESQMLRQYAPDIFFDENDNTEFNIQSIQLNLQDASTVTTMKDYIEISKFVPRDYTVNSDPLGISTVNIVTTRTEKLEKHDLADLGMQAFLLKSSLDRIEAHKHINNSVQTLLSRSIILNTFSLLDNTNMLNLIRDFKSSEVTCAAARIIFLMTLVAKRRIQKEEFQIPDVDQLNKTFTDVWNVKNLQLPSLNQKYLYNLGIVITQLTRENQKCLETVVDICTKNMLLLSTGSYTISNAFSVTQFLIDALPNYEEIFDKTHGPFALENVLSAFILSKYIKKDYKEWAATTLYKYIAIKSHFSKNVDQVNFADISHFMEKKAVDFLQGHENRIGAVSYSKEKKLIASGGFDGTIRLWNIDDCNKLNSTFVFHKSSQTFGAELQGKLIDNVIWSSSGDYIAASMESIINIWSLQNINDSEEKFIDFQDDIITCMTFPKHKLILNDFQNYILVGCISGKIRLISIDKVGNKHIEVLSDLSIFCAVTCMNWCYQNYFFVIGYNDGTIKLGNLVKQYITIKAHNENITGVMWEPNKLLLATISSDKSCKIWKEQCGELSEIHNLIHPQEPTCLDWSPVIGNSDTPFMLAVGTINGNVLVWVFNNDNDNRKVKICSNWEVNMQGHFFNPITSVSFHSSGLFLASRSSKGPVGVVNIWSMHDGSLLYSHIEANGGIDKNNLIWLNNDEGLIMANTKSEVISILKYKLQDFFADHPVATARMSLLKQGIENIKGAPFLKLLINYLGNILTNQHQCEYENVHNGTNLMFSSYFKALTGVALLLNLDKILCYDKLPFNEKNKRYFEEFSWLDNLQWLTTTANSLFDRTSRFKPLFYNVSNNSFEEVTMENSCTFEQDKQIVKWFNSKPNDWTFGGICDVFMWGSHSKGQLAELNWNTSIPSRVKSFSSARKIICGYNCTYVIQSDGVVLACGDGSHGRLGQGNSEDLNCLSVINGLQGYIIVDLATSFTEDGHCLAFAESGEVFSWGHGIKIGQGSQNRRRRPKQIETLLNEHVVQVACAASHSAVVTKNGKLFTFGNGDFGHLGLGDTLSYSTPQFVAALEKYKIGYVSCGLFHSACISKDGLLVWTWGEGRSGQLGLGSTTTQLIPQRVESLCNIGMKKVGCGSKLTIFLTIKGKIFTSGSFFDTCATDSKISTSYTPQLNGTLNKHFVVNFALGEEHILFLTNDNLVFGWGMNSENQLGLLQHRIAYEPTIIPELSDKNIIQIAAGKSHSAAWTASIEIPGASNSLVFTLPEEIPSELEHLKDLSIENIRTRLKFLYKFSLNLYKCCPYIPLGNQRQIFNQPPFKELVSPKLNSLLITKFCILLFQRAVWKTMRQDRNFGPQVSLKPYLGVHDDVEPMFLQLANQIKDLPLSELRLHSRPFKIRLIGEAADDAGGVLDDTLSEMCKEIISSSIPLLIPTPNQLNKVGDHQDKYIFNPEFKSQAELQLLKFLGILFGIALRTKKPLPVFLSPMMWKLLTDIPLNKEDFEEIDIIYFRTLESLNDIHLQGVNEFNFSEYIPIKNFEAYSSNGKLMGIVPNYQNTALTFHNRCEYVEKVIDFRLHEFDLQSAAVLEGMAHIIPVPLLSLFSPQKLEEAVCGIPYVSVDILKKVTKHKEDQDTVQLVNWLWEILESWTNEERAKFMRFVSGRSRLPANLSDLSQNFQVIKIERAVNSLPTAQTCFFLLRLPLYTSREIMAQKLKYSIYNCCTIDLDHYINHR